MFNAEDAEDAEGVEKDPYEMGNGKCSAKEIIQIRMNRYLYLIKVNSTNNSVKLCDDVIDVVECE